MPTTINTRPIIDLDTPIYIDTKTGYRGYITLFGDASYNFNIVEVVGIRVFYSGSSYKIPKHLRDRLIPVESELVEVLYR